MLIGGDTYRKIAAEYEVSLSTLSDYLARPEHAARAREALANSADQYADKAEEVLMNAERDPIEMQRARELAQHYRWKSSKRNPGKYGEKLDVHHGGSIENRPPWLTLTPNKPEGDAGLNE